MPKLIALICKETKSLKQISKNYYENNHVPLIKSLFPTIAGYKRTYLLEANSLSEALPLESDGVQQQVNVITEIFLTMKTA